MKQNKKKLMENGVKEVLCVELIYLKKNRLTHFNESPKAKTAKI